MSSFTDSSLVWPRLPRVSSPINSEAYAALREEPAPRRTVAAWSLWDFGSNAFNTVILSFVFSVYVTTVVADSEQRGQQVFSNLQTVAGILVAVLAPLMGAWADRVRNRRLMLGVSSLIIGACMAALWFVEPKDSFLFLGAGLIALTSVVQDVAGVFYNGMLLQISTPKTIGRISGTAWGLGYLGGVICLVVALFGFVLDGGFLGLSTENAVNIRAIALFCAVWLVGWSIPVMLWGPDPEPGEVVEGRFNPIIAYRDIGLHIAQLWRTRRELLHFLLAAAIYRDGLNAVFAFAGVIAAASYGFSSTEVIYFGLAANLIAATGTWVFGRIEDRIGPRHVIVATLSLMVLTGVMIVVVDTKWLFWVGGMVISSMVGAVQSSSRTMLARIIPVGEENETFGLYATVGRAVSFIAPAMVALFTMIDVRWGIMGIVVTLLIGLLAFLPLRIEGVTHNRVALT